MKNHFEKKIIFYLFFFFFPLSHKQIAWAVVPFLIFEFSGALSGNTREDQTLLAAQVVSQSGKQQD